MLAPLPHRLESHPQDEPPPGQVEGFGLQLLEEPNRGRTERPIAVGSPAGFETGADRGHEPAERLEGVRRNVRCPAMSRIGCLTSSRGVPRRGIYPGLDSGARPLPFLPPGWPCSAPWFPDRCKVGGRRRMRPRRLSVGG